MPTYDYKCTVCDERFEVTQSIHEDSLTTIEDCAVSEDSLHHVKKVFGAVSISFKGSGFYRNDSRGSKSSTDTAPSSTSNSSSSSSSSSTETKTPAKSEKPSKTTSDNSAA